MDPKSIIAIILVGSFVWIQARKSYETGLCWSVFFLVWMPHTVRIETSAIPAFTIHRIILLILISQGISQGKFRNWTQRVPLFNQLLFIFIAYAFSTLFAVNLAVAFKRMFEILFECYLVYIAITAGISEQQQVVKILKATVLGLLLIAVFSPLEYYIGLNVIGKFLPTMDDNQGVISTYESSIHFGYAMALGVPFAVIFTNRAKDSISTLFYITAIGVLLIGCYFSFSRGALVGAILALVLVLILGGKPLRKISIGLCIFIAIALIVRPGVRDTLYGMLDSIFAHDGEQDASAEYRKILWTVAWTKISASPIRLMFGLGGGSTMLMDISGFFGAGRGGQLMDQGFSSWDSQWAANLVQFGIIGFAAETLFWLRALLLIGLEWLRKKSIERDLLLFGVLVGCAVYLWAMLTVAMFSPQLRYLAAIYLACGVLLVRSQPTDEVTHTEGTIE